LNNEELMNSVWDVIPPYPERKSGLQRRLDSQKAKTADRDAHGDKEEKAKGSDSDEEEAAPPAVAAQDDIMSMMMGAPTEAAAQAPAAVQQPAAPEDDLLSMMMGTPAAAAAPATAAESVEDFFPAQDDLEAKHFGCPDSEKVVVYEGKVLQASVQMRSDGNTVMALLLLRIRGPTPLTDLTVVCPPDDQLNVLCKPDTPVQVTAQTPHTAKLMIKCRKPFPASAAAVQLRFTYNGSPVSLTLRCPLYVNHFVNTASPNREQFIKSWQGLAAKETMFVMSIPMNLNPQQVGSRIQNTLRMAVLADVSPNPATVSCAGTFNSIGVVGGNPITMPMLLMVDVAQGQIRIKLRTGHPGINAGLEEALLKVFRGTKKA
jgi:AP-2 complex subunit alpha